MPKKFPPCLQGIQSSCLLCNVWKTITNTSLDQGLVKVSGAVIGSQLSRLFLPLQGTADLSLQCLSTSLYTYM